MISYSLCVRPTMGEIRTTQTKKICHTKVHFEFFCSIRYRLEFVLKAFAISNWILDYMGRESSSMHDELK